MNFVRANANANALRGGPFNFPLFNPLFLCFSIRRSYLPLMSVDDYFFSAYGIISLATCTTLTLS